MRRSFPRTTIQTCFVLDYPVPLLVILRPDIRAFRDTS
jgi:hypothetical protein